jgi:hypothetical protein
VLLDDEMQGRISRTDTKDACEVAGGIPVKQDYIFLDGASVVLTHGLSLSLGRIDVMRTLAPFSPLEVLALMIRFRHFVCAR